MTPTIHHWPELPSLPAPHQPVLVRVAAPSDRRSARQLSRAVLREILSAWSQLPAEQLPLLESPRGPVWSGTLHGESLTISLSYTENEVWIALLRGARIGVDAMELQPFPEIETVAKNFFDAATTTAIRQSKSPAHTFATAWTVLEARLKCLKLDLIEWSPSRDTTLAGCHQIFHQTGNVFLTVATATNQQ